MLYTTFAVTLQYLNVCLGNLVTFINFLPEVVSIIAQDSSNCTVKNKTTFLEMVLSCFI